MVDTISLSGSAWVQCDVPEILVKPLSAQGLFTLLLALSHIKTNSHPNNSVIFGRFWVGVPSRIVSAVHFVPVMVY